MNISAQMAPAPAGNGWVESLRDPLRMRVVTVVLIWAAGAWLVSSCWSEQARIVAKCRGIIARSGIQQKISVHRGAMAVHAQLLPGAAHDVDAWLDEVRRGGAEAGLQSIAIHYKPAGKESVGSYHVLEMDVTFEAAFRGALAFVHWLETTRPRPRVARFTLERGSGKTAALSGRVAFRLLLPAEGVAGPSPRTRE